MSFLVKKEQKKEVSRCQIGFRKISSETIESSRRCLMALEA